MPPPFPAFVSLTAALGRRLDALRAASGLTQEDAAVRMGLTARHLQRLEAGGENPSLETLCRVAAVYGLTVPELLTVDPAAADDAPQIRRARTGPKATEPRRRPR